MRIIVQRVKEAQVSIDGRIHGQIKQGPEEYVSLSTYTHHL